MMINILSKKEKETIKVAELLAQEILRKPLKIKKALIIGLQGELGSGKTRFVQGFAKGAGIKVRLTSPTFVLMKRYKLSKGKNFDYLYHIDCYRLKKSKELLGLDFEEIVSNPKNIVLIEWAEKIRKILPKSLIWVKFEIVNKQERKIVIK